MLLIQCMFLKGEIKGLVRRKLLVKILEFLWGRWCLVKFQHLFRWSLLSQLQQQHEQLELSHKQELKQKESWLMKVQEDWVLTYSNKLPMLIRKTKEKSFKLYKMMKKRRNYKLSNLRTRDKINIILSQRKRPIRLEQGRSQQELVLWNDINCCAWEEWWVYKKAKEELWHREFGFQLTWFSNKS